MTNNSFLYGWNWVFWVFWMVLLFSMMGNWGYTYRAHRRFSDFSLDKDAVDLLSERYAKGDISREEFHQIKDEITLAQRAARASKEVTGFSPRGTPVRGT